MSQHTPGPWAARFMYRMIRHARSCPGDLIFDNDPASDWADAELIAAAPDLLEACRQFERWDTDPHATEADAAALREIVSAAIARAIGEREIEIDKPGATS